MSISNLGPLPWQEALWQRFSALIQHNKLSHAVVLAGQDGTGKEHFARSLAAGLYCESPDEFGIACGRCGACHQFQANTISDFRWIVQDSDASSISVDQIRGAIEFFELSRDKGRKKIALVRPADRMTVNAANSLLKTLEEPPGDALIMLLTSHPERLPITVRSRCQLFTVPTPEWQVGQDWLLAQGCDDSALALDVTGCAPLAAKVFCADESSVRFQELLNSLRSSLEGRAANFESVASWKAFDIEELLVWMSLISEWMVLQKAAGSSALERHLPEMIERVSRLSLQEHLERHERLLEMKRQRGVSVNRDLVLDQLQILWSVSHSTTRQSAYRR